MAFFNDEGMLQLYSGVKNIKPSASTTFFAHALPTTVSVRAYAAERMRQKQVGLSL